MTCIAVKDGMVAADRKVSFAGGIKMERCKLTQHENEILGTVGDIAHTNKMRRWYIAGADVEKFPNVPNDNYLMVFNKDGWRLYEADGEAQIEGKNHFAWGSGSMYAIGALDHGATAKQAVETASKYCSFCGMGVDVHKIPDWTGE